MTRQQRIEIYEILNLIRLLEKDNKPQAEKQNSKKNRFKAFRKRYDEFIKRWNKTCRGTAEAVMWAVLLAIAPYIVYLICYTVYRDGIDKAIPKIFKFLIDKLF